MPNSPRPLNKTGLNWSVDIDYSLNAGGVCTGQVKATFTGNDFRITNVDIRASTNGPVRSELNFGYNSGTFSIDGQLDRLPNSIPGDIAFAVNGFYSLNGQYQYGAGLFAKSQGDSYAVSANLGVQGGSYSDKPDFTGGLIGEVKLDPVTIQYGAGYSNSNGVIFNVEFKR